MEREKVLERIRTEVYGSLTTAVYRCRECGTVWVYHCYDPVMYPRPYSEPWDGKGCKRCIREARECLNYRD